MAETPHNMNELTKGKPIAGFGKTNTAMWLCVSLALHTALIGGTSVGYITDRWIDPEAAAARKQAAIDAAAKAKAEAKALAQGKAPPGTPPAAGGATTAPATQAAGGDKPTDPKANTPVMQRITETAKPGELPTKPDDLGIDINETNKTK